jgi:phage protein
MEKHADRNHALLSASGAYRWLKCPGSARLEDKFEDEPSVYAAEGTLAHEIAELKIVKHFTADLRPSEFKKRINELKKNELYSAEMDRYTNEYRDYINDIYLSFESKPFFLAEQRVDFSSYVPEGFGTVDCTLVGDKVIHIFDLKYGKGVPVTAENNPQGMLYALGTYLEQSAIDEIEKVVIHIIQPRIKNTSSFEISSEELLEWAESIKDVAQKAYKGSNEFHVGEHCGFCKANGNCRKQAEKYMDIEVIDPALLTDEEIGEGLAKVKELSKWAKKFEDYALVRAQNGGNVKGWKLVAGRGGNRTFTDKAVAAQLLEEVGLDREEIYKTELISVTAAEKLLGEETLYKIAGNYILKPEGKPTLATLDDKRPALELRTPAEVFKDNIE